MPVVFLWKTSAVNERRLLRAFKSTPTLTILDVSHDNILFAIDVEAKPETSLPPSGYFALAYVDIYSYSPTSVPPLFPTEP